MSEQDELSLVRKKLGEANASLEKIRDAVIIANDEYQFAIKNAGNIDIPFADLVVRVTEHLEKVGIDPTKSTEELKQGENKNGII